MNLRLISSVSNVITNSSTQVFFIDVNDKIRELIQNGSLRYVLYVKDKEDFKRLVQEYEDNKKKNPNFDNYIFSFLNHILYEETNIDYDYDNHLVSWENSPGDTWEFLNEKCGKSYSEILEFIWPLIEDAFGEGEKGFYEYGDDCGFPRDAEILEENGYSSYRTS